MRPSALPLPELFTNWSSETGYIVQEASTSWTNFSRWSGVASVDEVSSIVDLMRTLPLDVDMDTVDGMPTLEMFVDNDALRAGKPSKGEFESADRAALRAALREVMDPILDRLTPWVRETYPGACNRVGRECVPCYSLVRRYRPGLDRASHGMHHDGHAIATVVVSLSDYGVDYEGGLYVSTGRGRQYLALDRGDAVVHRSDLLHGVQVLGRERWSWILWYRDSLVCADHSREWFASCAAAGNPTCEMLHATKVSTSEEIVYWNALAASHGHNRARVKMARAYLKKLPSSLPYDLDRALSLYGAAAAEGDPNAHYGLAEHYLGVGEVSLAVQHLESSALGGNPFAMFNLGVAHGRSRLGLEWFVASGLPEGYYAASVWLESHGESGAAYKRRASILGYPSRLREMARERTGVGGAAGVPLYLPWP